MWTSSMLSCESKYTKKGVHVLEGCVGGAYVSVGRDTASGPSCSLLTSFCATVSHFRCFCYVQIVAS